MEPNIDTLRAFKALTSDQKQLICYGFLKSEGIENCNFQKLDNDRGVEPGTSEKELEAIRTKAQDDYNSASSGMTIPTEQFPKQERAVVNKFGGSTTHKSGGGAAVKAGKTSGGTSTRRKAVGEGNVTATQSKQPRNQSPAAVKEDEESDDEFDWSKIPDYEPAPFDYDAVTGRKKAEAKSDDEDTVSGQTGARAGNGEK